MPGILALPEAIKAAGEKAAQNPAQSVHAERRTDSHNERKSAAPLAFAGGAAVSVPPRGVEFLRFSREIPQSRKIPDQIPDHFGWPPTSAIWFDSSRISRRGNAKPS
jgi:hypothetical protein